MVDDGGVVGCVCGYRSNCETTVWSMFVDVKRGDGTGLILEAGI